MKFHSRSSSKTNRTAIFWAVLSQVVWLPLFFIDAQDHLSSKDKDYDFSSVAKLPQQHLAKELETSGKTLASGVAQLQTHSATANANTGILLNPIFSKSTIKQLEQKQVIPSREIHNSLSYSSIASPPKSNLPIAISYARAQPAQYVLAAGPRTLSTIPIVSQLFKRSELLGGTLTLQELNEPSIPPLARAERAKWSRSGDPLAPLPQSWREPMRKALFALTIDAKPNTNESTPTKTASQMFDAARIIHVPSSTVRRSTEVPLALQADGTVDILNQPEDPAVIDEIKRWSVKQNLPAPGRVSPAVVHLHALSQTDHSATGNSVKVTASKTPTTPSLTAPAKPSVSQITSSASTSVTSPSPALSPTVSSPPVSSTPASTPSASSASVSTPLPESTIATPPTVTETSSAADLTPPPTVSPSHPAPSAEAGQ